MNVITYATDTEYVFGQTQGMLTYYKPMPDFFKALDRILSRKHTHIYSLGLFKGYVIIAPDYTILMPSNYNKRCSIRNAEVRREAKYVARLRPINPLLMPDYGLAARADADTLINLPFVDICVRAKALADVLPLFQFGATAYELDGQLVIEGNRLRCIIYSKEQ